MEILNKKVKVLSDEIVEVHSFGKGYVTKEDYQIEGELAVKDGKDTVYLEAYFDSMRNTLFLSAVAESLFDLYDRYPEYGEEYEKKYDEIVKTGLTGIISDVNIEERYKNEYEILKNHLQEQINRDKKSYDLNTKYTIFEKPYEDENLNLIEESEENISKGTLYDKAKEIMSSPNYNTVKCIKKMVMINDRPFYGSFGSVATVKRNLELIFDDRLISPNDINITFKLSPDKYLKGIVLSIPECKAEFDAPYLVIAYYAHQSEIYTCEYMEEDYYGLRRNEGPLIKMYNRLPEIDEIWNEIYEQYDCNNRDGLFISFLHVDKDDLNSYIMFDYADPNFINHWFGEKYRKKEIEYNGNAYYVFYSMLNNNFAILRNKGGKLEHIQECDMEYIPEIAQYCKANIESWR